MPATYKAYSKEVVGYVAPLNEDNAEYIATAKVQKWLDSGKSEQWIILTWNGKSKSGKCHQGENSYGVAFNSCAYVAKYRTYLAAQN